MAELEAIVEWPGLEAIESFRGTLAHGITPGVFQIECYPQKKQPAKTGTLTLRYGTHKVEFKDCKMQGADYKYNESGEIIGLNILDRRHRWSDGFISGCYNQRLADGTLVQKEKGSKLAVLDTERKPQDMAKLCLEAMKESGFNVGDLPNQARPAVAWDYTNPSRALANLCDSLGARVVLQTDNKIKLCQGGKGKELDGSLPYESYSEAIDLSQIPESMIVIGDRVLWQVDIPLEAVGQERDESIKLLEELSYKPADWGNLQTHGGIADKNDRQAAIRSVFRMYRIVKPITLAVVPAGVDKVINDLELILPLVNRRGETKTDPVTKQKLQLGSVCYGKYFFKQDANYRNSLEIDPQPGTADIKDQLVRIGHSLDTERGIVTFSDHVYQMEDGKPVPATIFLRCCVHLRSKTNGQFYRYERTKKTGESNGQDSPPMTLHQHGISVLVKRDKTSNQAESQAEADYYIDAKLQELRNRKPQAAEYVGWHPIELDGAIQSIHWEMGAGGCSMTVQRNDDQGSPTTLPHNQRLNLETVKAARAALAQSAQNGSSNAVWASQVYAQYESISQGGAL